MENVTLSKKKDRKVKEIQKTEESIKATNISTDINMLISGMIKKDGKSFTRVSFLRDKCWAEGIVPDGVIEKSEGFSEEELVQLKEYLVQEKDMILEQAKGVNPLRNLFGI